MAGLLSPGRHRHRYRTRTALQTQPTLLLVMGALAVAVVGVVGMGVPHLLRHRRRCRHTRRRTVVEREELAVLLELIDLLGRKREGRIPRIAAAAAVVEAEVAAAGGAARGKGIRLREKLGGEGEWTISERKRAAAVRMELATRVKI